MKNSIKLLFAFLFISPIFNSNCMDFGDLARRSASTANHYAYQGAQAVGGWAQRGTQEVGGWMNNHRLETALGSASVVGFTTLVRKFGKDNVFAGAAVIGATYAGNGIRHWWQLRSIDNQLDKARRNQPNSFLYATWRESQWSTAVDIDANKRAVKQQLKQDAQDGVFSPGGSRKKTLDQVRNAINTEKRQLEEWMRTVGGLTNAPKHILTMSRALSKRAHEGFINGLTVKPETEKVFKCVQRGIWYLVTNASFNGFKKSLDNNTLNASSVLRVAGCNPANWAIAPCATKATNLYWELFKAYIRLNALKTILEEKDEADKGEQLLGEAKSKLDEMIGAQPNAYITSVNKQQQIVRLSAVQSKIRALQKHYSGTVGVLSKLTPIASQLDAINTSLLRHDIIAYPDLLVDDPVKGLLIAVKGMVEAVKLD